MTLLRQKYLFRQSEQKSDQTLNVLIKCLEPDFGLIKKLELIRQHYDEPKFWYYSSLANYPLRFQSGKLNYFNASGISLYSEKLAFLKCLCETVERFCNYYYEKDNIDFVGKYNGTGKAQQVNPETLTYFAESQLSQKKYSKYRINKNSVFSWSECTSLSDNKPILIPSQLIYLSYQYLKKEPIIYHKISTGAAGGSVLASAILRGIYEIVERDVFMIYYLNKLEAPHIKLDQIDDPRVKHLLESVKRYDLELICLNLITDTGIPTVASIIVNKNRTGKRVSVGLKSNLNIIEAIIGSAEESLHSRDWLRRIAEDKPGKITVKTLLRDSSIINRGLLWYPWNCAKRLSFWIKKNPKEYKVNKTFKVYNAGEELKIVADKLYKLNYSIYYKNIKPSFFKSVKYHVVKVIIPEMQPLYLRENFPLLGNKRLNSIPVKMGYRTGKEKNEFNSYPHPFL